MGLQHSNSRQASMFVDFLPEKELRRHYMLQCNNTNEGMPFTYQKKNTNEGVPFIIGAAVALQQEGDVKWI